MLNPKVHSPLFGTTVAADAAAAAASLALPGRLGYPLALKW